VRTLLPFERAKLPDATQQQVILPLIERVMALILKASPYWRQFGAYFNFLREWCLMGVNERQVLLNRGFVGELAQFLIGADSPFLGPKVIVRPYHHQPLTYTYTSITIIGKRSRSNGSKTSEDGYTI
jgi:hypothetical protein